MYNIFSFSTVLYLLRFFSYSKSYTISFIMIQKTPISIIEDVTRGDTPYIANELIKQLKSLYRFELFKPLLDLTATLAKSNRLQLIAENKRFYTLDEGNCLTIDGGIFDKVGNIFKRKRSFKVTIKKVAADVIIHELAHMMEKECDLPLNDSFMKCAYNDISKKHSRNVSLNAAIDQVMVKEVNGYPKEQQPSELFARFFQLLAMTKQVSGYGASYGFMVDDFYKAFPNVNNWMSEVLLPMISVKIDPIIASASKVYIVELNDIKHKWSEERVKSVHKGAGSAFKKGVGKWSSNIPSVDD